MITKVDSYDEFKNLLKVKADFSFVIGMVLQKLKKR